MVLTEGLIIALLCAALLACGLLMYALVEAIRALRSARSLCDELGRTIPPVIEKADVAVDALSVQLLRIDEIFTKLEGTIDRVSHTAGIVQEAAHMPAAAVSAAGERIREVWSRAKRSRG